MRSVGGNADPVITSIDTPTAPVAINTPVEVTAPFTDPDIDDTHTCTIDWGDTTTPHGNVETGVCIGSHSYTAAGVYTLTVADDNDGWDIDTLFGNLPSVAFGLR